LHFSAKSEIQLLQLITNGNKQDYVAAKIMQKPSDEKDREAYRTCFGNLDTTK
jgi:hypothetical protein